MTPPDGPRDATSNATRRRVRVFVGVGVLAVLVVGFWPLPGYRIEDHELLSRSVGVPDLRPRFREREMKSILAHRMVIVIAYTDTYRNAQLEQHEALLKIQPLLNGGVGVRRITSSRFHALAVGNSSDVRLAFQYRNISGSIYLPADSPDIPPGSGSEEFAIRCLNNIVDGLESEAPGVRKVSMPLAVQLWKDRVRPFLEKHFP